METQPLFWDVLESRRSIRKFKPDRVSTQLIERILSAGVQAPNARNRQSWRFAVLSSAEQISVLADALNGNFRRDMLAEGKSSMEVDHLAADRKARICAAPVIILLLVDTAELGSTSSADPEYLMAVQSVALAGGQILLAAQALGLGGLWMGGPLFAQEQVSQTLALSDQWLAQGMLLIGYADEAPDKKERKALKTVVKYFS